MCLSENKNQQIIRILRIGQATVAGNFLYRLSLGAIPREFTRNGAMWKKSLVIKKVSANLFSFALRGFYNLKVNIRIGGIV